ncbi:glycosyltransferase family 25 protein [Rhodovulum sulfidophilum]|uniref:glycosyltransferase family 25 protein n=1 Tax=Rhodovulum sulfidophilum TaxID=35806 RepID=UPI001924B874|nr:glycosyltransferase family 25 protein [Rhodovulum sulfidophilum]MBL3565887.1 glycosyltransferase family 25 protein [Rhodovulum sulfidophilum]
MTKTKNRPRLASWRDAETDSDKTDIIPVALVSLDDATARRADLRQAGFPADWVEGYWPASDLRNADEAHLSEIADMEHFVRSIGRRPLPGEIGCALSHRRVMEWLANSDHPLVLIFEDDARPADPRAFDVLPELLIPLFEHGRQGASFILHLGVKRRRRPKTINRVLAGCGAGFWHRWIVRDAGKDHSIWLAHAYVISREAARRTLAAETPIRTVADDFMRRGQEGLHDHFLYSEPGLFLQPPDSGSMIDPTEVIRKVHAKPKRKSWKKPEQPNAMGKLKIMDRLRRLSSKTFHL